MLLQIFHESEHNVVAKIQILFACFRNGGKLTCRFIRVCWERLEILPVKKAKKLKQSRYRPGVAQRLPGS
jgi:hypothetical protein